MKVWGVKLKMAEFLFTVLLPQSIKEGVPREGDGERHVGYSV